MRLEILPEAKEDSIEASLWYWSQGPGLDSRFERALDRKLERLMAFPESAPVMFGDYRSVLLDGFPYLIVYHYSSEALVVHAVWQASRDPSTLLQRLGQPEDE